MTGRADDPQLRTHVVVPNVVRGVDGRWSAFNTGEAYRQALTGGYLYQAVLRGELSRRLGVRWGRVRRGVAEIDGVPAGLRQLFSTRRGQVVEYLEATGRSGPKAATIAALSTRSRKSKTPEPTLRERWAQRAVEAGFSPGSRSRCDAAPGRRVSGGSGGIGCRPGAPPARGHPSAVVVRPAGAPEGGVRGRAARVAGERGEPAGVGDGGGRDGRTVPLLPGAPVPARRYSTTELLATEQAAVWAAAARGEDGLARPDLRAVEAALAKGGLSAEQGAAVRRVTSSGAGVEVVVGPAGAGKTAALAAARGSRRRRSPATCGGGP